MSGNEHDQTDGTLGFGDPCCRHSRTIAAGITRRGFLGGLGGAAACGGAVLTAASEAADESQAQSAATTVPAGWPLRVKTALPAGPPLRVQPALLYAIPRRVEKTSWRPYGGLQRREDVDAEARRIDAELKKLAAEAEFPIQIQPLSLVANAGEAKAVADADCDVMLVYASGGDQAWIETLAASKKPNLLFVRHRSGPVYLWYEIAHWRLLRKNEDTIKEPNLSIDDIVVDDYADVLWRLRALYGLKNARGTKCAAIGGLQAYSVPGQQKGPAYAKDVWGFEIISVPDTAVSERLRKARSQEQAMDAAAREADALLAQPNVTLQTDRRFVVNTFLALKVFKDIMKETGATNLGVAHCMGSLIGLLDTPPCLVLSLLNDEGFTAFCHTDFTHTPPGVLLRWISGRPSFVCNSHFPHDGVMTLAHCSAPRRMNGRDCEPTQIMTHWESDYGAATKVTYRKGQVTTNIIPNLNCTTWFAFRGRIIDTPSYDMCRTQMDVQIDGDWRKLLCNMQGFHTITCYGDYLREVGYVVRKLGIEWENVSESA